jgi:hypothetical protein
MVLTLRQAQARILNDELPSSEAALLLNEVIEKSGCDGGCDIVEVCVNEPVLPFYEGLKTEPF